MGKRITLVTMPDDETVNKIQTLIQDIPEKMCKVPLGMDDTSKCQMDNLPYHFTIFATDKENESYMLQLMHQLECTTIKIEVEDVCVKRTKENGFMLYLSIKKNAQMYELQNRFYSKIPTKNYNPQHFVFHMTLHIDKEESKVLKMQEIIKAKWKPFTIECKTLGLFNYPGEMIKQVTFSK